MELNIEIIKEFINLEELHSSKSNPRTYLSLYQGAVEELLKNYIKQQKEIKELSEKLTEKICKGVEEEILEEYRQTIISKDKEIEELKSQNNEIIKELKPRVRIDDTEYIERNYISKDKIKKILGIDEDIEEDIGEYDEEKILYLLQTIVAEFNRLEHVEDRKVQVAVDNIEKKRDKYWKDTIRAKIKEIDEDELLQKIDFGQISLAIKVLYELLEE